MIKNIYNSDLCSYLDEHYFNILVEEILEHFELDSQESVENIKKDFDQDPSTFICDVCEIIDSIIDAPIESKNIEEMVFDFLKIFFNNKKVFLSVSNLI